MLQKKKKKSVKSPKFSWSENDISNGRLFKLPLESTLYISVMLKLIEV